MTMRSRILRLLEQEDLNFLLTNRIPRRLLTQFMGWFSQLEQPLVRDISIGLWRFFSDLDLREARSTKFRSMHDCFIRQLKHGARPVERSAEILVSPCDAIVGATGTIALSDQGIPLHAGGTALRPRSGRGPSRRPLRHIAADLEHVPPLSRAA